jgi:hypothetical protein
MKLLIACGLEEIPSSKNVAGPTRCVLQDTEIFSDLGMHQLAPCCVLILAMRRAITSSRISGRRILVLVLLFTLASTQLLGVVLARKPVLCPVCGEKNDFYMIIGMGDYVYEYPPKYYALGWGYGYPALLWVCKHCHYAAWAWDFSEIDAVERSRIRTALRSVQCANFNDYAQVPLHFRLALAEQCARAAQKEPGFWNEFYRAQAYHLGRAGRSQEARETRIKARDLLLALLSAPRQASEKKELLFELATVHHFLGDDPAALAALSQAREERLADSSRNDSVDYRTDRYIRWIKTNAIPPDAKNRTPSPLMYDLVFDEKGNYKH